MSQGSKETYPYVSLLITHDMLVSATQTSASDLGEVRPVGQGVQNPGAALPT